MSPAVLRSSTPAVDAPPHASGVRTPFLAAGNPRPVLHAACAGRPGATLAVVLETEGSTYAHRGALACFDASGPTGWLSGGCLEPALALDAARAARGGMLGWTEIDTRADEDLLSGSATGCRGRLRIAMLPLCALPGVAAVADSWLGGGLALAMTVSTDGDVSLSTPVATSRARLPTTPARWTRGGRSWSISIPRPPEALLLGAGPETGALLGLLHQLGWWTTLAERRPRWRSPDAPLDRRIDRLDADHPLPADAALVMHHNFELDRAALDALAGTDIPFVGLLGPARRREDLFRLLRPAQRTALAARLRSPVGLPLGGQGPEAIALSIAAQLQAWRADGGTA